MSADLSAILARLDALEARLESDSSRADKITLAAAEAFGVAVHDVRGRSREDRIVCARHAAMYMLRKEGRGWSAIGRAFGRNHDSVIKAHRSFLNRMANDPLTRAQVEGVEAGL